MAEGELSSGGRFRSAARHYLAGRPNYAPRLIDRVARFTGLTTEHRVLDLGCGPGLLAGAFARLAGEVIGIDPEPEMLRIAEITFGATGARFVEGSSAELSPALGHFRLVTMGRSFHWMDRTDTLRRLDAIIEPGGAVALFASRHCEEVPDNTWLAEYRAAVRRYAVGDRSHVRHSVDSWVRHEAFLLDSAFSVVDEIGVIERRQVSVDQLIHRALSRSSTTEERLGSAASRLAADIEALLRPMTADGVLTEMIATSALIGRRP